MPTFRQVLSPMSHYAGGLWELWASTDENNVDCRTGPPAWDLMGLKDFFHRVGQIPQGGPLFCARYPWASAMDSPEVTPGEIRNRQVIAYKNNFLFLDTGLVLEIVWEDTTQLTPEIAQYLFEPMNGSQIQDVDPDLKWISYSGERKAHLLAHGALSSPPKCIKAHVPFLFLDTEVISHAL